MARPDQGHEPEPMKTASLLVFATAFAVCLASGPASVRAQETEVVLTATSANVAEAGSPATIRIHRWSTEAERTSLVTALNPPPPPPARGAAAGDQGGGGRAAAAGRGARGRGRGGAPA